MEMVETVSVRLEIKAATCSLCSFKSIIIPQIISNHFVFMFFAGNIYRQEWFRCLYILISCANLNLGSGDDQPSGFGVRYLLFKRAHSATGIVYHRILILLYSNTPTIRELNMNTSKTD